MRIKNSSSGYGLITKILHWTIALDILFLVWLGWYMVDLTYFDKWYNGSLHWHKSLGMLILPLAAGYFAWKWFSPSPQWSGHGPAWQRHAASAMHAALMALMVLIPVSGYLISTSAGKPVSFFGWFDIPAPGWNHPRVRDLAIAAHYYFAYGIGVLALGHALAALKHQFVDRDGTLQRMLWR